MSGFVGLGAALLLMVAIVAFIALTLWLVDRTGGGCIIIALLLVTIGGIAQVKTVQPDKVQPVFNLQIADGDSFFVGGQGVLAHDNSIVSPTEKPFDGVPAIEDPSKRPGL
jgi:hypothetical protein